MSNKIYHEACGQPTEYTLTRPKFCAACGGSFDASVSKASAVRPPSVAKASLPQRKAPAVIQNDDDDDDFEDPSDFEAPSKLEVTVDMTGSGLNRVPLSAIASQGIEPGSLLSNSGRVAPKMTKKAVKEKYKDIYQKLNSRTPMRGTGTEE